MCGYCVEAHVMLNFIERQRTSEVLEFEDTWPGPALYLQESTHFPEIINQIKTFNNFSRSIDVAFCRLWEIFLYQHHQGDIYHRLVNGYGTKVVNDFLVKLKSNCHYEKWNALGE